MNKLLTLSKLLRKIGLIKESEEIFKISMKFESVYDRFESKKFIRAFNKYYFDEEDLRIVNEHIQNMEDDHDYVQNLNYVKQNIAESVPYDIPEKYRGASLQWLISLVIKDPITNINRIMNIGGPVSNSLEIYFQIMQQGLSRILSKPDLFTIGSLDELLAVVDAARPEYYKYLEKKEYLDAEKGMKKIAETEEYEVFIPTNKGAACALGKGTDWCTASPGLGYYEQYHSEADPLIIFMHKTDKNKRVQFHYGTDQFMDVDDNPISWELKKELNEILASSFPYGNVPENVASLAEEYKKKLNLENESEYVNPKEVLEYLNFNPKEETKKIEKDLKTKYKELIDNIELRKDVDGLKRGINLFLGNLEEKGKEVGPYFASDMIAILLDVTDRVLAYSKGSIGSATSPEKTLDFLDRVEGIYLPFLNRSSDAYDEVDNFNFDIASNINGPKVSNFIIDQEIENLGFEFKSTICIRRMLGNPKASLSKEGLIKIIQHVNKNKEKMLTTDIGKEFFSEIKVRLDLLWKFNSEKEAEEVLKLLEDGIRREDDFKKFYKEMYNAFIKETISNLSSDFINKVYGFYDEYF